MTIDQLYIMTIRQQNEIEQDTTGSSTTPCTMCPGKAECSMLTACMQSHSICHLKISLYNTRTLFSRVEHSWPYIFIWKMWCDWLNKICPRRVDNCPVRELARSAGGNYYLWHTHDEAIERSLNHPTWQPSPIPIFMWYSIRSGSYRMSVDRGVFSSFSSDHRGGEERKEGRYSDLL